MGEAEVQASQSTQYDVIIIGAGISGLGAACHLQRECPDKTYIILEGRETIGGTWSPVMFNAVPHLEAPDRHHAQTHV